jgi:hypothetical protein
MFLCGKRVYVFVKNKQVPGGFLTDLVSDSQIFPEVLEVDGSETA